MASQRIAVIEDEAALAEVLQYNLERAGFDVQVYSRGDTAWEGMRERVPDAILLDLMLPGLDGLELGRILKRDEKTAHVPIIMLTARTEEVDRIVGLELGADDYITKPFSPREVVLRVKAVLRRTKPAEALGGGAAIGAATAAEATSADETIWIEAGDLRIDVEGHRAYVGDEEIALTPIEFRLLSFLLERKGRAQTRAQLLADIWGYADDVDSRTVDTHIRRLRKKLAREGDRIETVVGVGYRLRR